MAPVVLVAFRDPFEKRLEPDGKDAELGLLAIVGDQRDRLHGVIFTKTSKPQGSHVVFERSGG